MIAMAAIASELYSFRMDGSGAPSLRRKPAAGLVAALQVCKAKSPFVELLEARPDPLFDRFTLLDEDDLLDEI